MVFLNKSFLFSSKYWEKCLKGNLEEWEVDRTLVTLQEELCVGPKSEIWQLAKEQQLLVEIMNPMENHNNKMDFKVELLSHLEVQVQEQVVVINEHAEKGIILPRNYA